jgi:hypothetical protein
MQKEHLSANLPVAVSPWEFWWNTIDPNDAFMALPEEFFCLF